MTGAPSSIPLDLDIQSADHAGRDRDELRSAIGDGEHSRALLAVDRPQHHALQRHGEHVRPFARDDLGIPCQPGTQPGIGRVEPDNDPELAQLRLP